MKVKDYTMIMKKTMLTQLFCPRVTRIKHFYGQ